MICIVICTLLQLCVNMLISTYRKKPEDDAPGPAKGKIKKAAKKKKTTPKKKKNSQEEENTSQEAEEGCCCSSTKGCEKP